VSPLVEGDGLADILRELLGATRWIYNKSKFCSVEKEEQEARYVESTVFRRRRKEVRRRGLALFPIGDARTQPYMFVGFARFALFAAPPPQFVFVPCSKESQFYIQTLQLLVFCC